MARESAPAFQFYPKDWQSDERVRLMSHTERGIYIDLLCHCWLEGSLPADAAAIARLVNLPAVRFGRVWDGPVGRCFHATPDGRYVQKRLEAEREKQTAFRRRQSDAAASRWHAPGIPSAAPSGQCSPISDLQSSSSKEEHEGSFLRFWAVYPKKEGRKAALDLWLALRPPDGLVDRIVAGAERYAAKVRDWQGQYIKSARNWLDGAHWEDGQPTSATTAPARVNGCFHAAPCIDASACTRLKLQERDRGPAEAAR